MFYHTTGLRYYTQVSRLHGVLFFFIPERGKRSRSFFRPSSCSFILLLSYCAWFDAAAFCILIQYDIMRFFQETQSVTRSRRKQKKPRRIEGAPERPITPARNPKDDVCTHSTQGVGVFFVKPDNVI
ncbi:unnamed protein product [Scytosiphon promiscuus]